MKKLLCIFVCILLIFNVVRVAMQLQRDPNLSSDSYDYLAAESVLQILSEYEFSVGNSLTKFVDLYSAFETSYLEGLKEEKTVYGMVEHFFKTFLANTLPIVGNVMGVSLVSIDFMTALFEFAFALLMDAFALVSMTFDLLSILLGFREYAPTA